MTVLPKKLLEGNCIIIVCACVDGCFVASKAFQLDSVCCVLEMALSVCMTSGSLRDCQKILLVRLD